jgi:hypothetical protein
MVEMPGGGLTTMIKTISEACRSEAGHSRAPVRQGRDSKIQAETVRLIIKLLKMDKEAATETMMRFKRR